MGKLIQNTNAVSENCAHAIPDVLVFISVAIIFADLSQCIHVNIGTATDKHFHLYWLQSLQTKTQFTIK